MEKQGWFPAIFPFSLHYDLFDLEQGLRALIHGWRMVCGPMQPDAFTAGAVKSFCRLSKFFVVEFSGIIAFASFRSYLLVLILDCPIILEERILEFFDAPHTSLNPELKRTLSSRVKLLFVLPSLDDDFIT